MKFLGQVNRKAYIILRRRINVMFMCHVYVTESVLNTSAETSLPSGGSTKFQPNYLFPET